MAGDHADPTSMGWVALESVEAHAVWRGAICEARSGPRAVLIAMVASAAAKLAGVPALPSRPRRAGHRVGSSHAGAL